jgi:hypothetical protein
MKYLCVYNSETKKILYAIEEPDEARLFYTREAYRLQALCLGAGWAAYCDDKPFVFPIDNAS